jgi:hypothetical protein
LHTLWALSCCSSVLHHRYLHEAYALLGRQHNQWDKVLVIPRVVALDLNWVANNLWRIHSAAMW